MTQGSRRIAPPEQVRVHLGALRELGTRHGVLELDRAVLTWIGRGLLADRWAKLDQAGRSDAEKVRLSKVFVDASLVGAHEEVPKFVAARLADAPQYVLDPLVFFSRQRDRFDPSSNSFDGYLGSPQSLIDVGIVCGTLLIGGPGQGKSALTQMLAQVHRAWWATVSEDRVHREEARVLLDDTRDTLPEPTEVLLPVRIDLARLLARLRKGVASVATLLHEELGLGANVPVETTLEALRAVPVLLALDGLDEVPASGGRALVLEALDVFFRALGGARGILVITTRPQGYAREFEGLAEATIAPWNIDTAKAYAQRLFAQRYPDQDDERAQLEERIDEACHDVNTARLMTTALQVTMMAALVTYLGRPPRERWKLFLEYYRLIVAREARKPGLARDLLSKYERFVREIHQHVAVILQARAETDEATPLLDHSDLAAVARARLERESFPEDVRERLVGQIVEVATDRLVFLVQPSEGGFGFEVRSLQEFFAAGALTTGDEEAIVMRLAEVARSSSWSNAVVFAVGRAMEDFSPQMQERLTLGLCGAVDADGAEPLDGVAWPGAEMALQLLQDGAVLAVPRIARPLLDHALRLLWLPPYEVHDRLAAVCAEHEVDEATGSHDALITSKVAHPLAMWRAQLALAELHPSDRDAVVARWPDTWEARSAIFDAVMYRPSKHAWLTSWVLSTLEQYTPTQVREDLRRLFEENGGELGVKLLALCGMPRWNGDPNEKRGVDGRLPISFCPLPEGTERALPEALRTRLLEQPAWRPILAMDRFFAAPSRAHLAEVFDAEADAWEQELRVGPNWGPWVVLACLRLADTPAALRAMARRAREGELGDTPDWLAAERRWARHGLLADDVRAWVEGAPFGREIASRGTPGVWSYASAWREGVVYQPALQVAEALIRTVPNITDATLRSEVARQARGTVHSWYLHASDLAVRLSLRQANTLLRTPEGGVDLDMLAFVSVDDSDDEVTNWLENAMGSACTGTSGRIPSVWQPRISAWVSARWRAPSTRESVEWLAADAARFDLSQDLRREISETPPDTFISPAVAAASWGNRFWAGEHSADTLVSWWRSIAARGGTAFSLFLPVGTRTQLEVLRLLWLSTSPDLSFRTSLLSAIRDAQRHRRSALARNGTWARLQLPQPGPVVPSAPPSLDHDAPSITRISLSGFRGHAETTISLSSVGGDEGSLLLLLGENGTGKTTLLRGIAFALAADVAGGFVTQSRAPYLRPPTQPAECRVETTRGTFHAQVQQVSTAEHLVEINAPCRPFVAAYGCRRGSALGSPERATNIGPADFVDNLFDRPSGLTRAETWLHQQKPGTDASDETKQRYASVIEQLRAVLPGVSALAIDDDGAVRATLDADPEHPVLLEALSDGYLTTLGWVIDLMALWVHWRTKVVKQPLPPNFAATMSGYVLIDEIDLHLHPVWQTHVLADLRKVFPKLHFIATTHNPMTLVGAKPGEVRRLVRDPVTHRIVAEDPPQDPRLKTGGELYEHFFGIDRLYPTELGEALQAYSYLAGDPDRSEEEERRLSELQQKLADAGVSPGWTPLPRSKGGTAA